MLIRRNGEGHIKACWRVGVEHRRVRSFSHPCSHCSPMALFGKAASIEARQLRSSSAKIWPLRRQLSNHCVKLPVCPMLQTQQEKDHEEMSDQLENAGYEVCLVCLELAQWCHFTASSF